MFIAIIIRDTDPKNFLIAWKLVYRTKRSSNSVKSTTLC